MVKLTPREQAMLSGQDGPMKQRALENVVQYAEILGAESLCPVSRATVFCGRHSYLEAAGNLKYHEMFSRVQLGSDELLPPAEIERQCLAQTCVSPCETFEYQAFQQSHSVFVENREYLDEARKMGVVEVGTCAPYLNGWLPLPGEHFVTTESGMTILGNSLWAARCNSDGIEAAFWSALCGRTPRWGRHLTEGRRANIRVAVDFVPETMIEWDLLGRALGLRLPLHSQPAVTMDSSGADFNRLRQFLTALAVSSNCEICHIVGLTPEAPSLAAAFQGEDPAAYPEIRLSRADLAETYDAACDPGRGPVDLVSLGCPHYDIYQLQDVARLLDGRRIAPGVTLQVWTTLAVKALADYNGFTAAIEKAGGSLYTASCPVTIKSDYLASFRGAVFDSLKQITSARLNLRGAAYYATAAQAVDAACSGEWKEANRWKA
ncbi:MAG: aconitase X catalytic domain-containing protein [Candidatus Adiutrix sp.]|jgi:predicted aconitase|nr:aconitase X catalytic domain-containing protein [Candidatus Adiutrix sp.]